MEIADTLTRSERTRHRLLDLGRSMKCLKAGPYASNMRLQYPRSISLDAIERAERDRTKATVPAGSNLPASWAYPLLPTAIGRAFAEYVAPFTIIGRLRDRVRRVPFLRPVTRSTTQLAGYWVGGGRPKPLTSAAFEKTTLSPATAAGMLVVANEILDFAAEGTEQFLVDELRAGQVAFLDEQFTDPANAGITDIAPAAITNGVTAAATSTGDPSEDLRTLLQAYRDAGGSMASAVLLLSSTDAAALALRSGANDSPLFPGLDVTGGTLAGLPALASDSISGQIIALDARGLLLADDLGFDINISRQATIEMSDAPTTNSSTGTGTNQVSLYQTNSSAFRVERHINWNATGAVALVDGVNYLGEGGSPA